jgi:hypothetical protein
MPVDSRSPIASPAQPQNLNDRHSIFDRGLLHVAHSLEGKQPDYVTDTTTGEVKEVVTPRKPGGLFRDIILEAMAAVLPAQTPLRVPESSAVCSLVRKDCLAIKRRLSRPNKPRITCLGAWRILRV